MDDGEIAFDDDHTLELKRIMVDSVFLSVSIMITTRNRRAQVVDTLQRVSSFDPPPLEILVTADGCEDDTAEVVEQQFPEAVLITNQPGCGSVASRAEMMNRAKGDLVLALDDDSYPEQSNVIQVLSVLFQSNPSLAIATFPQRTDEYPETLQMKEFGQRHPIRSFPNSGACLRVSAYRQLPGFEPIFFHMYEEPDYALQCVANGWEVHFFPEITIRHFWTPNQRNEIRNHHLHARNEFWSSLIRCPFPYLIGILCYRALSQAAYACKRGPNWLILEPVWWWKAMIGAPTALQRRKPVSWKGYQKWLSLPDH